MISEQLRNPKPHSAAISACSTWNFHMWNHGSRIYLQLIPLEWNHDVVTLRQVGYDVENSMKFTWLHHNIGNINGLL